MRRCFYHTDLGQNAVFHNFAMQDKYCTHSIVPEPARQSGYTYQQIHCFHSCQLITTLVEH